MVASSSTLASISAAPYSPISLVCFIMPCVRLFQAEIAAFSDFVNSLFAFPVSPNSLNIFCRFFSKSSSVPGGSAPGIFFSSSHMFVSSVRKSSRASAAKAFFTFLPVSVNFPSRMSILAKVSFTSFSVIPRDSAGLNPCLNCDLIAGNHATRFVQNSLVFWRLSNLSDSSSAPFSTWAMILITPCHAVFAAATISFPNATKAA